VKWESKDPLDWWDYKWGLLECNWDLLDCKLGWLENI
jgi:hypothetical protein